MTSHGHGTHQELTSSLKSGGNNSNSNSGSGYGSAPETDAIVINKQSSNKSQCLFKWIPLIFSVAALVISIIILIEISDVKTNSDDAMKASSSNEQAIGHLSRNAILGQFAFEQRIRSDGDSGITNTRQYNDGDAMYDDGTYSNGAVSAIHDHADFINVAGMGELQAVLNGVEFQTRHNDYSLEMPSTTSTEYGETEQLPFPDVPPEVLNAGNVTEQIAELQEWFRAFKTQNKSHRNYPDYFKPNLCYLEGTWIMDDGVLDEPFNSDRHEIDASTWKELHDKIRFMVNSGRKDPLENLAQLPSSIRNMIDDIYPVISNWEVRIVCHPLSNDIRTARFRVADDISVQLLNSPLRRDELEMSRRARFEISKFINLDDPDGDEYSDAYPDGYWQPGIKQWNYLDYLMEQVPGKDNYMANLTDELPGGVQRVVHFNDNSPVNSGYYNRFFALNEADAMGATRQKRGYNDRYMFTAQTSQEKVSPISMIWTETDPETGEINEIEVESRSSYAIPLEIVYTTPLKNWNPYNVPHVPIDENFDFFEWLTKGFCANDDPLDGWIDFKAYFTPAEFYDYMGVRTGADTATSGICALDEDGISHEVFASGLYITTPPIGNNVGSVRLRYPIPPLHKSGDLAFKEVKALEKILLDDNYDDPIDGIAPDIFGEGRDLIYGFDLNLAGGDHEHMMHVPGWIVSNAWYDGDNETYYNGSDYKIFLDTSVANGHEHWVSAWRWRESDTSSQWIYVIEECAFSEEGPFMDGGCADGHMVLDREAA
eukprot:CAMPEP_0201566736 /NCGR_PEP_ID=MMETSP0190_2-20130828/6746_1 /ASSEMBLY_ACC=CAM_ASM_000263 /TAXON_ID=37353 /ORGANISM="Rosalina sp." /LENGTH=768 /DNA_ID=CAMNT_0047985865 /DNA_START=82 /DNA_END=2388 /DNA_ORIENTATION=-